MMMYEVLINSEWLGYLFVEYLFLNVEVLVNMRERKYLFCCKFGMLDILELGYVR